MRSLPWVFPIYARCVLWVLYSVTDADASVDVLHLPVRLRQSGTRRSPKPSPPRFMQTGFPSVVWEMSESLNDYWQDGEQEL